MDISPSIKSSSIASLRILKSSSLRLFVKKFLTVALSYLQLQQQRNLGRSKWVLHIPNPFLPGSSFYAKSWTRIYHTLSNGHDSCGRVWPALSRKMWWSYNHLTPSRPCGDWHIDSVIYSYRSRRIACSHWSVPVLVAFSPPTPLTSCRRPARRKPCLRLLSNVNIQR